MNPAVPAPPDQTLVAETVRTKIPFHADLSAISSLAGDASNRRYYRLTLNGGSRSVILMQLASPETFKQSEEAVSGANMTITELPFINVLHHLAKADVPVPILYHYDAAAGLLYLEDFGDVTLADACTNAPLQTIRILYRQAIEVLVRIHTKATTLPNADCLAFDRRFDVPLLMWEFDHFLEYGVVARQGKPMRASDEKAIREEFQKIAELLAEQPRVLTHRDYHSRNLMMAGARLGVIDFQDALMGPAMYDLASLLRDAYITLDEKLIDDLIVYYIESMAAQDHRFADRFAFRRLFDLMSIQRNLKAAGRFVYIDRVKHNPKFLADIPRVLGYVKRNLSRYRELSVVRDHLAPYVPELQ
ncbi:MAG TPA: phosphotransferase, partial [Nitrospiraceae bacterium]|nr:phosphotransferase [Nitrospiraceae bacterium]